MAWYADLAPCDYFRPEDPEKLRAVGWLTRGHEYSVGPVALGVFERLIALIVDPWSPVRFRGRHKCELCTGPTHGHLTCSSPAKSFCTSVPS